MKRRFLGTKGHVTAGSEQFWGHINLHTISQGLATSGSEGCVSGKQTSRRPDVGRSAPPFRPHDGAGPFLMSKSRNPHTHTHTHTHTNTKRTRVHTHKHMHTNRASHTHKHMHMRAHTKQNTHIPHIYTPWIYKTGMLRLQLYHPFRLVILLAFSSLFLHAKQVSNRSCQVNNRSASLETMPTRINSARIDNSCTDIPLTSTGTCSGTFLLHINLPGRKIILLVVGP